MPDVPALLRSMYREYAASVGLSPDVCYLHGTPLRPVVPLDVGVGGIFILGAYPSARFVVERGVPDVPVADNLGPFERERWFDGTRVREQPSARELHDLFLDPLHVPRSTCWITDLVKVFLFKQGHVDRYRRLGAQVPAGYARERFFEIGVRSLTWIEREIACARPRLVITLGAEVAGVLYGIESAPARTRLLRPTIENVSFGTYSAPVIHCAHPGILMRNSLVNPWPRRHEDEFVPVMQAFLSGTTIS